MRVRRVVGCSVASVLLASTLVVGQAPSASGDLLVTIQPGQRYLPTLAPDNSNVAVCTLSWIYDGTGPLEGRVYVGTAAHCTFSVGDDIGLLTGETFGDVAARGALVDAATDWALIEVRPAFRSRVSAAMLNHPQYPTGVSSAGQTAVGDAIQLNDLLVVPKQATLTYHDAGIYRVSGPVIPTDSGGPLAHVPTGAALGTISLGLSCTLGPFLCEQYEGPTVEGILAQAAAAGFPVALRTV